MPWITHEMLDRMEEKRKYRNINIDDERRMYKKLNSGMKLETDKTQKEWLEDECKEMEEL
ncbi:hypothetical protein ILUMI_18908, partial [Ignelater luminosus]